MSEPAVDRPGPCLYCGGRRYYWFCDSYRICGACPEGKALLAELRKDRVREWLRQRRQR